MPKRKLPLLPLAAIAIVLLVAAILVIRAVGVHGALERVQSLTEQGIDVIRNLGVVVFFLAMTVLPAFGVPLMAFTITAGQAFEPQLGLAGVIAVSLVALAINLALGYWVSRYALRPLLAGLIKRYGYSVPRVTENNALTVTLLVRLTPGPPYALQACVLGLAEVPFRIYMIISWLALLPWVIGAIVLGKGLLSGKFGMAASGFGVLIVAVVLVQLIRRKYFRRKEA
jgi:uncharacterized membrane protein YdjX (TVP38/TMEM64 family)